MSDGDTHGLGAAKAKLMSDAEVSFDTEKVLAENRIREERKKEVRHEAEAKLEKELAAARLRGSQKRIRELEKERIESKREEGRELEVVREALDSEKARLKQLEIQRAQEKPIEQKPPKPDA